MPSMPQMSKLAQKYYCQHNFGKCARYLVGRALGLQAIPDYLSPSDEHIADEILKAAVKC
jgi:hypothetical protein